jgi:hypothetical protein
MKIAKQDIARVREAITPLDTMEVREKYLKGDYPRSESTKDVNRRYRWDLYWACGERFVGDDLLDSHIDTALRKIVPKLED